jgi:four helix bundle protein
MLKLGHKKLDVYSGSIDLVSLIYQVTSHFPKAEKYGLVSQLRRAAVSISSNISEGAARKSLKERNRFYEIARSSLVEVDVQLEIALNLNFLEKHQLSRIESLLNITFAQLSNMIKR